MLYNLNSEVVRDLMTRGQIMPVYAVNNQGEYDGESLKYSLSEDFVGNGYGDNIPCVMRYPDDHLEFGHKVVFSDKGMAALQGMIALSGGVDDLDDGRPF